MECVLFYYVGCCFNLFPDLGWFMFTLLLCFVIVVLLDIIDCWLVDLIDFGLIELVLLFDCIGYFVCCCVFYCCGFWIAAAFWFVVFVVCCLLFWFGFAWLRLFYFWFCWSGVIVVGLLCIVRSVLWLVAYLVINLICFNFKMVTRVALVFVLLFAYLIVFCDACVVGVAGWYVGLFVCYVLFWIL